MLSCVKKKTPGECKTRPSSWDTFVAPPMTRIQLQLWGRGLAYVVPMTCVVSTNPS